MVRCNKCIMKKVNSDIKKLNGLKIATCSVCKTEYTINPQGFITIKEVE